jgi:hypothetical protein
MTTLPSRGESILLRRVVGLVTALYTLCQLLCGQSETTVVTIGASVVLALLAAPWELALLYTVRAIPGLAAMGIFATKLNGMTIQFCTTIVTRGFGIFPVKPLLLIVIVALTLIVTKPGLVTAHLAIFEVCVRHVVATRDTHVVVRHNGFRLHFYAD